MQTTTNRQDIYERITNQILEALKGAEELGRLPWQSDAADQFLPRNAAAKRAYRGINVLSLWVAAMKKSYQSSLWGTYRQWQSLGANVRKGEKGTAIVLWKPIDDNESESFVDSEQDDASLRRSVVARGFVVFNADQVDGYTEAVEPVRSQFQRWGAADRFVRKVGASVREGMPHAFYSPEEDFIGIPSLERFYHSDDYYSVMFHELTHWTGASHRLDRNLKGRFGSKAYAAEELIAELGAAFLCGQLNVSSEPRADHASYIASWIELLRDDNRAIFTAAAKAQQAVDWMLGMSDGQQLKACA